MKGFPEFAKALFIHGSFSKPFLNMALDADVDEAWKMYFISIKRGWKKEYAKALKCVDAGLKILERRTLKKLRYKKNLTKYEKGKNLFYLLSIHKLEILEKTKSKEAEVLYEKLKNDYPGMPNLARKVATPTFFNHFPSKNKSDIKKPRIWSTMYSEDPSAWVFVLLGKAREVENGNISKSFSLFLEALRIAKNIPHPTGMINALNDMAWYLREVHPHWACEMAKRAVYWAGWYFEDVENVFYTFDTLFECQRLSDDANLYETANITLMAKEYLPKGHGRGTQGHYHDTIESCKHVVPNFGTSMYENSEFLREFLSKQIHSITSAFRASHIARDNISAVLNDKVKKIRGDTLKKFIKGLNVEVSLEAPFGVLNEYLKMRVENNFNESIGKLKKMKLEKRTILFVSTYMGNFNRRKGIPYLSRKGKFEEAFNSLNDVEKFKSFMNKRYETMEFVNWMFEAHPFIQARKDLARKYLERMPKRVRERFISIYISLEEKDKSVIDRFLRDYSRYDIKWSMMVKIPKEMEKYVKSFHLKKTPSALAYYALDNQKEREYLAEVLEKFG